MEERRCGGALVVCIVGVIVHGGLVTCDGECVCAIRSMPWTQAAHSVEPTYTHTV